MLSIEFNEASLHLSHLFKGKSHVPSGLQEFIF